MAKCPNCKSPLYVRKCMKCLHAATPKVVKGVLPCEWPCIATVHVTDSRTGKPIQGVDTRVNGAPSNSDANGFRVVENLKPGKHLAGLSLASVADSWARPIGELAMGLEKTIAAGANEFFCFVLDPLTSLKVVVKRRHDSAGIANAKVTIAAGKTGNVLAVTEGTTPAGGDVTFTRLRQDTYRLKVELDPASQAKYNLEPENNEASHVLDMTRSPDEHVVWARLVIHIKLKYKDPEGTVRLFPKDFPFEVTFDDGTKKDVKILDDAGYFKFEIEDAVKKKFTLKLDSAKARYLVHEKNKPAAELKLDPTDADLHALNDDGKQFFALPKTWSLAQSAWDVTDVVIPTDGQVAIPSDGIGTATTPATMTLAPKLQYARFEFHDRKFREEEDANKKPVSIPPVVLKACRESDTAGAPVSPVAGTHDTVSNWMVDADDPAKACQPVPWIITKTAVGVDLPKLNNKMMFEFGRENAFVQSTSATTRKIVVLPPTDARRKPTKDRTQYYDLPKQWKSKNYYTRFSDPSKNKCFDELAAADDADLEASYAKDKPLTFSLDDIVLVNGTSQAIKDKTAAGAEGPAAGTVALSKHSRLTILTLSRKDKKYNVVVYKPQASAVYWSESTFKKETAADVYRNLVVDVPINPRVVVFCSDFFDVFDKRTDAADFTNKEILGARAAKFEDTDVSSKKITITGDSAVTSAYVGYKSTSRFIYLHYCDLDVATVYGAIVTYWSARFEIKMVPAVPPTNPPVPAGGTNADLTTFRQAGLALAMKRWNDKDYYFEENDDKTELRIKHFCLFEAKGVQTAPGTFTDTGGKHICLVGVRDNNGGSSALSDGTSMTMRIGGASDEGESWGDPTGNLPAITRFEDGSANPKCAFAHELGHSAFGLFDSYLTASGSLCETNDEDTELSDSLCGYENFQAEHKDQQEYFGMPYEMDTGAIMFENRAEPRLRYFWLRANWLNDNAKVGGADKVPEFLAQKRFRAAYEAKDKPKLKYHRLETDRNIYAPWKTASSYSLQNHGKCDLHLYTFGDDEYARILRGGPYKGILAVNTKILCKFTRVMDWAKKGQYFTGDIVKNAGSFHIAKSDHANADFDVANWNAVPAWAANTAYAVGDYVSHGGKCYKCKLITPNNQAAFAEGAWWDQYPKSLKTKKQITAMETLNAKIKAQFGDAASVGKFKLYGSGQNSPVLIRILPHWAHETDPRAAHMTITFSYGSKAFQPNGASISAGVSCDPITLARYLYGKLGDDPTKWADQGLTGDIVKADLVKLSEWMNANADGKGFVVADNPV
jgi:hypothetical protein